MRPRFCNSRRLPKVVSPRLTTLVFTVSLIGAVRFVAVADKGDKTPAPKPKNAARELDSVCVRFRLPSGMAFPTDFRPQAYSENDRDDARRMWQPENRRSVADTSSLLPVRAVGSNEFEVRLSHPERPFYVAIHQPGFLRFFERGPFPRSKIKNGLLEIDVSKPATLEVHFDPGKDKPENRPFNGQWLNLFRHLEGTRNSYLAVGQNLPFDGLARFTDLAEGEYLVGVETQQKPGVKDDPKAMRSVNPGIFVEKRRVTLLPGQAVPVILRYVPYDPLTFRGHRTAVLRFQTADGKPAKNKEVTVVYFDGHYGDVTAFKGSADTLGEVVLRDITDRVPEIMPGKPFFVFLGRRCLGRFGFSQTSGVETLTFKLWPDVNDPAPDAELIKIADGKPIKLSSLRGKLVWIDFWATWCRPCQPAMKELDEVVAHEPQRWNDRVAIVPVSIDESPELVTRHAAKRGWTHLAHYWSGPSEINGFQSPAARQFVVDGVPTALLIAPDGRILWRGFPELGGKSVKDRIEEALGK